MNENELHERYIRLAFQYESAIDALLARGLVDEEAADAAKERFYDTLNEEKLRTTQKVRDYQPVYENAFSRWNGLADRTGTAVF